MPQLFVATGATKWNDPKQFPWTMGWQPNYQSEGRIYAKYILKEMPTGKIGILYQNDDYGKDYVKGVRDGLGAKAASMIVGEESYETTTPTIDSHVVALKSEGVDIFISITTPKFAAQSIKKVAELGWKPLFILNSVGTSTGTVMRPAGFENGQNIISAAYNKDPTDPQWKDDAGIKNFDAFLTKYFPEGQSRGPLSNNWLQCCSNDGSCSQTVRRRSYPREYHEAGREHQEFTAGRALARCHDQHQRN